LTETHEHDVLIIGAGGAGLRAAIEALARGATVGVVCKSLLGKAHTVMAEGGIAAAMANVDRADDWRTHFRDTMRGGKFLNNWRMAQIHAQEAPERVSELEQWGALFDRTADGNILQRAFGGHTFKRLCHVGDRTGLEMIRTLQDRGVHLGIDVYMECAITRLLKDGEHVAGAFGYWRENGRFVVFKAKSIVIATGGIGKAWRITSNSWEYTGDGMALAYDAGAELMDMEFVQFHPTGMVWPPGVQGILVTEAVRGEGGVLRNKDGERFMERYDPERVDLSTQQPIPGITFAQLGIQTGTDFADANLSATGTGFAVNFGAIIKVNDRLSIGGHWLTRKSIDYDGDAAFTQVATGLTLPPNNPLNLPGGTPVDLLVTPEFASGGPLSNGKAHTTITMPPQGSIGFAYKLQDNWTLMADYQTIIWGWFATVKIDYPKPVAKADLLNVISQAYAGAPPRF